MPSTTGVISELRTAAAWAAVGLANTLIHLGAVMTLVHGLGVPPVPANGLAFACANVFSYFANARFAFRSATSLMKYLRFLIVSLLGLAAALGSSALAQSRQWHYLVGVAISMALMPMLTYVAHRFWTWRPGER
jgi:putative flippase GtrA